ncbi:MAG TPA: hypothetical protein VFZ24_14890 [Longimicrobiales bacterium]
MSHLSLETIARLVEDAPDRGEAAHLESCEQCRTALAAMNEDVHALSLLPDVAAAPDGWAALERRLVDEGLIRTPRRSGMGGARMMQIAAALLLFLAGSVAGRMTAAPAVQTTAAAPTIDRTIDPAPVSAPPAAADDPQPEPAGASPIDSPARRATLASNDPGTMPMTFDEAALALRRTEEQYLTALTRFAELASQSPAGDPVARLAALQSIVLTTQAALSETPTDPVINGYHLTALAQRDATLRQVAAASEPWY